MAEATKKTFKPGDKVSLVLAGGKHAPAQITKVNKNGTVDLEFEHNGETQAITSSPFDEHGKRADCFCEAPAATAATAPPTPAK